MKHELECVANFLIKMIVSNWSLVIEHLEDRNDDIPDIELLNYWITGLLRMRYREHWFPERPGKCSGYRCIRINSKMDPIIQQALELCGLPINGIRLIFPKELTIWVDPNEVTYRIDGSDIFLLYPDSVKSNEKI